MPDFTHKERPRRLFASFVRGLSAEFGPCLDYPLTPSPPGKSLVDRGFWGPRIQIHQERTLPHALEHLSHNIENFQKAAGKSSGSHAGLHWDDSDLYKVMEGAAYSLARLPDDGLRERLEELIEIVAGAQEPDGYLYTARTIAPTDPAPGAGPFRWSFMPGSHELYCMGHLIEAGIAHYHSTGRRSFLNVALLAANRIDAEFGPDRRRDVCGHPEIELALARLYRTTGDMRYLRLCRFFVDERGRHESRKSYGEAEQDHLPALEQPVPVGHAVRATYLYSAMTDVAALMDDQRYAIASDRLWNEVVGKHLTVTGAVGPRHDGEAFGDAYELPTSDAHYETCAAVGLMLWCHRLFLPNAHGRYLDVLERALYNVFLSSHSLEGRSFFYCNPLEAGENPDSGSERPPWQGCACCPTNVARIVPMIPDWAYASRDRTVYIGLYLQGSTEVRLSGFTVQIRQETAYPWDGDVRITLTPESERPWSLEAAIRVPGWAVGSPVPSDLYTYVDPASEPWSVLLDGRPVRYRMEKGFARVTLSGDPGSISILDLRFPMPARRVVSHLSVKALAGKVCLERGPIVYCWEGIDHPGVTDASLSDSTILHSGFLPDVLGGVSVLQSDGPGSDGLFAIPYYAWNNRGPSSMAVWLMRTGADS